MTKRLSSSAEPEFCFVAGLGGSIFMDELLDVAADAVQRAGGRVRTAVGSFPAPQSNTVYVIIPHEYFVVTPTESQPSAELLARTIGFCVEHPGTLSFERTAQALPKLAYGVDINLDSTAELRRRGNRVEHFQLGYSPLWDAWGGDLASHRPIDVTYLGTEERRRSRLLSSYWRDFSSLNTRFLTPPHEMMGPERIDFLPGASKFGHLARSRFLLNLHRGRSVAFEWVRALEALCNGCVVVSEPSPDIAPLVAGKHFVMAQAENLGAITAALAQQPERERELRQAGYEFVKNELNLLGSATMLIELGKELVKGSAEAPATPFQRLAEGTRSPAESISVDTPSWDPRFAPGPLGPPPQVDEAGMVTALDRTKYARRSSTVTWHNSEILKLDSQNSVDVDVIIVRKSGDPDVEKLVTDLLTGTVLPGQILIGEDGTASPKTAQRLANKGCSVLTHELALGVGYTRNSLLSRAKASHILVLDACFRAVPTLVEKLSNTIVSDAAPEIVHCLIGDPLDGLVGALPPEERRLKRLPYLGAGYLINHATVDRLDKWTEDPSMEGLEDHILWRKIVQRNRPHRLVQQVLLYRTPSSPMRRPIDLAPQKIWSTVDNFVDNRS